MYYLLLPDLATRTAFIDGMRARGVGTVFHYIPLHSAPAGRRYGRTHGEVLPVTDSVSDSLVRLPLWPELGQDVDRVIDAVCDHLGARTKAGA
jgi:dTDP-4-amino-4,6-dideoxygalactose transaminase